MAAHQRRRIGDSLVKGLVLLVQHLSLHTVRLPRTHLERKDVEGPERFLLPDVRRRRRRQRHHLPLADQTHLKGACPGSVAAARFAHPSPIPGVGGAGARQGSEVANVSCVLSHHKPPGGTSAAAAGAAALHAHSHTVGATLALQGFAGHGADGGCAVTHDVPASARCGGCPHGGHKRCLHTHLGLRRRDMRRCRRAPTTVAAERVLVLHVRQRQHAAGREQRRRGGNTCDRRDRGRRRLWCFRRNKGDACVRRLRQLPTPVGATPHQVQRKQHQCCAADTNDAPSSSKRDGGVPTSAGVLLMGSAARVGPHAGRMWRNCPMKYRYCSF
eukprot:Rhum_TRINITY_DN2788_c0_g2::Rhum_TRINITY_DN2788_c0_g2_i1::g.8056::m.8056